MLWKLFLYVLSLALLFVSPVQATGQQLNNSILLNSEETQALHTLRTTLKANSSKILKLVNAGKEDSIEQDITLQQNIDIAKTIEKKYPKAAFIFNTELDAKNPAKYQPVLDSIVLHLNEKRVIPFEDGSFLILQSKTQPNTTVPSGTISTMTVGEIAQSHTYNFQIWGIYKAADLNLITDYMSDINGYYVYGTDVNVAYSAYYPTSVTSATASWISKSAYNSSQTMKSKGFFALRDTLTGSTTFSRDYTYTLYTSITSSGFITDSYTSY